MKVKTGISGLDRLMDGGIPEESVVLLSGCTGTGKTIFGLQFLAEGARKYGERGLYITFEEREDKIREQAEQFGWDFTGLEKKRMLKILNISKFTIGEIFRELSSAIRTYKPRRLVVDSITNMCLAAHVRTKLFDLDKADIDEMIYGEGNNVGTPLDWDGIIVKKMMVDLVKILQSHRITALLTSEVSKESEWYSRDTISEFACDGVMLLKAVSIGEETQRTLELVKMRNTPIRGGIYNFEFTKSGVKISV
ncbi:MAG: ATPase domain-containing protein [Candidatus Micrarchaeota archaeon]